MKKSLVLGAAIILSLSLASCNNDNNKTTDNTIHVESVSVASIHELEIGETFTVGTNTVTVLPDNATDKSYSLSSDDKDVFTTSGYVITAVGEGSATLTVTTTDGGFKASTLITVIGTGGDENPNTGGEGGDGGDDQPGTGGEGGGGEPDTGGEGGDGGGSGGGEPDTDKDVTITTNPESITVKGGETASFTISVTEGAAVQSVVSDNDAVTVTGSGAEWTITATNNGDDNITATITITAGGEGFKTATATLPVTVTPADEYTYTLSLDNTGSVPTDWYYDDTDASFEITGTLHVFNRGTEETESAIALTNANATVTVDNDEHNAESIIGVSGLTISPAGGVGQVVVTVTYSADDPSGAQGASQSFSIEVQERYTTTHEIKIKENSVPAATQVGASEFDIAATLTTKTTAGSTSVTESGSRDLTDEDVSSGNVTITCNPADAFTINGRHAIPNGQYDFEDNESVEVTFTVIWAEYVEDEGDAVTDSAITTLSPKEGAVYTMTLANEAELTATWHSEDEARTASLTLTSSDPDEDPVPTIADIISAGNLEVNISGESITNGEGDDILKFTPVKAGYSTVVIYWSEHTEANVSFSVTISDYSYEISITNKAALQESWSIEDAEARTLSVSLTTDREDIDTTASTSNVTVTYDDSAFTSSDGGFTLTPQGTAEARDYTITVEWIDESIREDLRVSDSVTVTLDDTIKVTNISLNPASISWEAPSSTTITATLTGKDGATPTNQGVTWSVSGDSTITIDPKAGLSVTVTASAYNASATITAESDENPDITATCVVSVGEAAIVPATYVSESYNDEVVGEPDDNGIYVIGAFNNATYIGVDESDLNIVNTYNEAAAIRTIALDGDTYALKVGDKYIDDSLSAGDGTPNQAFTISESGIMLGSSQLYIDESGLTTTNTGTPAYILDEIKSSSTLETTSGENAFYLGYLSGGVYHYANAYSSNRFTTTTDPSEAFVFSLESAGENLYYLSYNDGGSQTYIYGSSSSNNISTSTTKSGHTVLYDDGVWYTESGEGHALMYYASNSNIGFYASSNLGGNNIAVTLIGINEDELTVKGISISANESYMEGYGIAPTLATYPSGVNALADNEVTWTYESNDEGTLVINGSSIVAGNPGTVTLTATYNGSVSDSCTIIIESSAEHEPEETLLGVYDFEANTTSDSNAPGASTILSFMNTYYTVNALSDPLNDVTVADSVLRGTGSSGVTDLRTDQGCMRLGTSSKAGELQLDFGTTEITKIVVRACGMAGNNYTLTVNTNTFLTMSQNTANLTSRTEVAQYEVDFGSGVTTIDMASSVSGSTGHRVLIYDIEIYGMM